MTVITMTAGTMVLGLLLAAATKGSPQIDAAAFLARVGQAVTGCSLVACMTAFIVLNSSARDMTFEERAPVYGVRAMAIFGVLVGVMIAFHAVVGP